MKKKQDLVRKEPTQLCFCPLFLMFPYGHSWHEPSYRGLETRKMKERDRESHCPGFTQDELDLLLSLLALVESINYRAGLE